MPIGDPRWIWELTPEVIVSMAIILFFVGLLDSTLGMGYGTVGVPLLIGMGFHPHAVVPAMILGQMVEGSHTTYWHTRLQNVLWGKKKGIVRSREGLDLAHQVPKEQAGLWGWKNWTVDQTATVILSVGGVATAIFGAIMGALLPGRWLAIYIGIMVLAIGLFVIVKSRHPMKFRYRGLWALGAVAAFNRGIGGGGYGPVATGGQIVVGRNVRGSIGSVTFAEVFISLVAFITWIIALPAAAASAWWWTFTAILCLFSGLSSPVSATLVRKFGEMRFDIVIGIGCILIGLRTFIRAVWGPIIP